MKKYNILFPKIVDYILIFVFKYFATMIIDHFMIIRHMPNF